MVGICIKIPKANLVVTPVIGAISLGTILSNDRLSGDEKFIHSLNSIFSIGIQSVAGSVGLAAGL